MGNVVHLYIGPGSESIAELYSFASTDYMWFVGQVKTPTYKVFLSEGLLHNKWRKYLLLPKWKNSYLLNFEIGPTKSGWYTNKK